MTIGELKSYIYDNHKIEFVLEQLGCWNIKNNKHKEYISASFSDGDNPQGINIHNNKYLNYRSFSRGVSYEDNKDLIDLVEYVKDLSFIDAVKYLHDILDLPFELTRKKETKKKFNPLDIFTRGLGGYRKSINVNDIHFLNDKILHDYVPYLHISWLQEGITERARKKFGICYSFRKKRIVIPHRFWLTGEIIGTNERTVVENYNEFGIRKYMLSKGYNKQINLYGYWENKNEIEKKGYCVLVESEKSVLKRYSLFDGTCLALSGKSLSTEQKRIISSLNIREVIICMDNDVSINEIRWIAEQFKNNKKVSYIRDFLGILGEKDSPCDACDKDYRFLFDNRIVYDRSEQDKYQKSLNNK